MGENTKGENNNEGEIVYKVVLAVEGALVSPLVPQMFRETYATVSEKGKVKPKRVKLAKAYRLQEDAQHLLDDWNRFKLGMLQLWTARADEIIPLPKGNYYAGVVDVEGLTLLERVDDRLEGTT